MHGLNDAAKVWHYPVWDTSEELNCKWSSVDYGVSLWFKENFENQVVDKICRIFHIE